ncbi:MAG TPA: hypothetical protein VI278_03140 [Nitrososphaeraceae archaeon]
MTVRVQSEEEGPGLLFGSGCGTVLPLPLTLLPPAPEQSALS